MVSPLDAPLDEVWVVALENEGIVLQACRSLEDARLVVQEHYNWNPALRASIARFTPDAASFETFAGD